jgi:hypothetical protein
MEKIAFTLAPIGIIIGIGFIIGCADGLEVFTKPLGMILGIN